MSVRALPADRVDGALVPRILPTIAWVELDGEAVLYDEVAQRVHVLNPTATLVWTGIDGRSSLDEIAGELAGAFRQRVEVVRSDVLSLVRDLASRGLLAEARTTADRTAPPGQGAGDVGEEGAAALPGLEPPGG